MGHGAAYATLPASKRIEGGIFEKRGACTMVPLPCCTLCAARRKTIAMSSISLLRSVTPISCPNGQHWTAAVEEDALLLLRLKFQLGSGGSGLFLKCGGTREVAALPSVELEEGAGMGTISSGSPGGCAGGLPPMLSPKGKLEKGSEVVVAALSDRFLPDECATGGRVSLV